MKSINNETTNGSKRDLIARLKLAVDAAKHLESVVNEGIAAAMARKAQRVIETA